MAKFKKGDLVTLINAHPGHKIWTGLVTGTFRQKFGSNMYYIVLGSKDFINPNTNLIEYTIIEENLMLISRNNK